MIARFAIEFFFTIALVVVPLLFALLCRWLAPRRYWRLFALIGTLVIWGVVAYGYLVGRNELVVHRVEYVNSDLPEAFDGFRIVQFSDAHVPSLADHQLLRIIDSINAEQPDIVVFTGDMVNVHPAEVLSDLHLFDRIVSRNGVISVLGNHDYPIYCDEPESEKAHMLEMMKELENRPRWMKLMLNENGVIRRDSDSIVIAGMENWGMVKRMPRLGDVQKTMAGVDTTAFVVMLQHDPTAWRAKILPECHAQLTLSGHTHGGQFSLFGWSPVSLSYNEWAGFTYEGNRALFVSTGVGGLIPFRLNMPGEIVVITLKKYPKDKS